MGFPPILNSLISFFRGCRALALPQGRFTAFAPANKGALRAQGGSRVPSAAHLLYHGKHNGFHPKGARNVGGGFSLPRALLRAHRPFRTGGIRSPVISS